MCGGWVWGVCAVCVEGGYGVYVLCVQRGKPLMNILEPTILICDIHVHMHVVRTDLLVLRVCWLECCRDASSSYPYQGALES